MQKKVAFYSLEMPILGKSGWSLENLLFLFIFFYYLGFSLYGNLDYMESRYGDGKVLGTQLHSTSRSVVFQILILSKGLLIGYSKLTHTLTCI